MLIVQAYSKIWQRRETADQALPLLKGSSTPTNTKSAPHDPPNAMCSLFSIFVSQSVAVGKQAK